MQSPFVSLPKQMGGALRTSQVCVTKKVYTYLGLYVLTLSEQEGPSYFSEHQERRHALGTSINHSLYLRNHLFPKSLATKWVVLWESLQKSINILTHTIPREAAYLTPLPKYVTLWTLSCGVPACWLVCP